MIQIDEHAGTVIVTDNGSRRTFGIGDPEAFDILSRLWLRCGWDTKYPYTFSWFGRPIIQLPEDMVRIQEVIYSVKPTTIIETGIAHGGSLVFYASLLRAMGQGRVIGIDIDIRPHNRHAIETHELKSLITLIEGSSIQSDIVDRVHRLVTADDVVLVVLDSNHSKAHVLAELVAYAPLVTVGSYIVATDGIMRDLAGAPRSSSDWKTNNPYEAAQEFVAAHRDFVVEQPAWPFNESLGLGRNVTYWPGGWLRRIA